MQPETSVCACTTPAVKLPVLPCPVCGLRETPVLGPGRGPHVGELRCQHGHHIKWAPKALLSATKDLSMNGINRVILVGTIGQYGVTVKYAQSGAPCASFALMLSEHGQDGKVYTTLVDCEVWGKKAEAVSDLEAGQLALFEGKLAKRKKGETWELVVSGFDLTPVLAPQAHVTGPTA